MSRRDYDAILLDLDGTLVTDEGEIRPRSVDALRAADARGVRVMVVTGRSEGGVKPVLEQLGLDTPAIVYNGAGLWCPVEGRLLEERTLSNRLVAGSLAFARACDAFPVVMRSGEKFAPWPRTEEEERAISYHEDLHVLQDGELPTERLMRITLFSGGYADSQALLEDFQAAVPQPAYLTHFPLHALAQHRASSLLVLDVQPPCRGKGEALRVLEERYGIPPQRAVAVGDANNDVPMLNGAGLAVAMGNAFRSARAAADRVIGDNNGDAIAELVEELFLGDERPDS
ncbi:MAG: HAD family hydrolase [Planctomycetota bacterium]|nr:HAD family hydrolase [Planctomycetota bacterium]